MSSISRRNAVVAGALGLTWAGLRAAATGLPAWFLANPRRASAADMQCTLANKDKLQYLVASSSSAGDPISCNVPGTYDAAAIIHPTQAEFAATSFSLGSKTVKAAQVWSTLSETVRARSNFFHHITGGTVHGDHPKVMRFLGKSSGNEMWASIYAKHLAKCLGTVQAEPVCVSAGNSLEQIAFQGRTLAAISATQLKQLLSGSMKDPVAKLRTLRDQTLDDLNTLFKDGASQEQAAFMDALHTSQIQVRQLAEDLADTFAAITEDGVEGQGLAAAALIKANVTSVVTLHIPFGADNHEDAGLYDEWFQHTDHNGTKTGVPGIQSVIDSLGKLGLADKATFATMNVFGRDLAGTAKVSGRNGRDHFGNHSVMLMIGKNVAPGVTGGATPLNAAYVASDIDSQTGASKASGGDIARADTHIAAAKTLGVALGIDAAALDADFTDNGSIKYVPAAVVS
jgi:hypothetical protein